MINNPYLMIITRMDFVMSITSQTLRGNDADFRKNYPLLTQELFLHTGCSGQFADLFTTQVGSLPCKSHIVNHL